MHGSAKMKVPNGKMVEAKLEYGSTIKRVQLLGDFFVYPDSGLNGIEETLEGLGADAEEGEIAKRVSEFTRRNNVTLVGVTPEAIASVVKRAMSDGMESNKA
ncbi:MAG: biotin--protein ligase [Candidatus Marsarchaeota archaeon]|nr:biotin--protein ligase [Candidatus Marsarchaeota archaeon]MCL5111971.1 biotin--protein ligase [Candidatus Marsarchaeota archaeon]